MIDKRLRKDLFKTFYPDHDKENNYIAQRLDKAISQIKTLVIESLGKEKETAGKYHNRPDFNSYDDVAKMKQHEEFMMNRGYNQHKAEMEEKFK